MEECADRVWEESEGSLDINEIIHEEVGLGGANKERDLTDEENLSWKSNRGWRREASFSSSEIIFEGKLGREVSAED